MGILPGGLHGPTYKKTGSITARRHRHLNVVSAPYRKSNKPPTDKQLDEQSKFGLLNRFLSRIDMLVKPGFKKYAKGPTEVNAAFSYNYPHAFVKTENGFALNYPEIKYSRGHIATPEEPQVKITETHLIFSWLPQTQNASCQYTDLATFLIYDQTKQRAFKFIAASDRYTGEHNINIPKKYFKGPLHCYMSFASANGKLVGDSIYVARIDLD
ncbi:DUF6266 family protein [Pedobacter nyackensis]|uniref:Uncharacterized protein n=1 Tax=Pedobacter nyackensis TaxID=475255 RepID=A0A1W2AR10_9SPHI|nr:DUF6266 family protein [Pedobacter nyackensis]SMC63156.1 hypothetical protein SAMN04488101_101866 [Pedobacter nyackensis]